LGAQTERVTPRGDHNNTKGFYGVAEPNVEKKMKKAAGREGGQVELP